VKVQIKTAINSNHDPFPHFQNLAQLLDHKKTVTSPNENGYSLQPLEITYQFPDYRDIKKGDPRKLAYKLRELFGTGFETTLPSNYPTLPTES
ncbi:hypothetical protein ALC56_02840, partial [Trachymyrmex septentrionalis]